MTPPPARSPGPKPDRRAARPYRPPADDKPRRAAYDVLAAVREKDAYANLVLPALLRERSITGRDAALATELAYGALRGQGLYDAVVQACVDRPLAKVDPPVLDVLRLGAHQLLRTRIPPHAAVSATVDLARRVVSAGPVAFVNAVLRKIAAKDLPAGELHGDLVGTATTAVRLGEVRPEGKGAMAAADWLRGLHPEPGERLA